MLTMLAGGPVKYIAAGLALLVLAAGALLRSAYIERGELIAANGHLEQALQAQAAEAGRLRREREVTQRLIREREVAAERRAVQLSALEVQLREMEQANAEIRALGDCVVPDVYIVDWLQYATGAGGGDGADASSPRAVGPDADASAQ